MWMNGDNVNLLCACSTYLWEIDPNTVFIFVFIALEQLRKSQGKEESGKKSLTH
jgi:hypothetical protein